MNKAKQITEFNKFKIAKQKIAKECIEIWRMIVLAKAGFKCEYPYCECKEPYNVMQAHHFYSKGAYPSLKYDTENGMCLCASHHTAGFGKESAHSDPNFKDKILGRKPFNYPAIRTEEWCEKLIYKAQAKQYKTDVNLEYIYLTREVKKYIKILPFEFKQKYEL